MKVFSLRGRGVTAFSSTNIGPRELEPCRAGAQVGWASARIVDGPERPRATPQGSGRDCGIGGLYFKRAAGLLRAHLCWAFARSRWQGLGLRLSAESRALYIKLHR